MTPRHHPDGARLIDYATGAARPGERLVLASHLGACPVCRRAVAEAEAVGGALLAALPGAAMDPDALALALARIERPRSPSPPPPPQPADWITVPPAVLRAARDYRRWAAPGVWVAPVDTGGGPTRSYLLGVAAGMSVPRHTHRGVEMVCVLKGAFLDRDDLHGPGDFACSDETVEHRPRITPDGDCVCLVCAEGPLVPRDWVGRLFQPLVGI
jgi:putative transcriptional regulator